MKKLLICTLLALLLVTPLISAQDWDNWVSYDDKDGVEDKVVTITNWLGLGETIGHVERMTPQVNHVFAGKDVQVMRIKTSEFDETYIEGLKDVEIKNLNTGKEEQKHFYWEKAIYQEYNKQITDITCGLVSEVQNGSIIKLNKCTPKVIGTTKETKIVGWEKLSNVADIPKGEWDFALVTEVNEGDCYDGIPIIAGKKVDRWAVWNSSLNVGVTSAYYLNNTVDEIGVNNFTVDADATYQTSIALIGKSANLSLGTSYLNQTKALLNTTQNFTISYWVALHSSGLGSWWTSSGVNADGTTVETYTGLVGYGQAPYGINFKHWQEYDTNILTGYVPTTFTWQMITIRKNDTGITYYINKTSYGSYLHTANSVVNRTSSRLFFGGTFDTPNQGEIYLDAVNIFNRSLSDGGCTNVTVCTGEIADLYNGGLGLEYDSTPKVFPEVTLNSPDNASTITKQTQAFNCSATGSDLSNISLWIDNIMNYTFIATAGQNASLNYTVKKLSYQDHNWTCEARDTDNNVDWATSNRTFAVDYYTNNLESYNTTTYETAKENFLINITFDDSTYFNLDANLVYNGSEYNTSEAGTGTNLIFTSTVDIPLVASGGQENKTFFWKLLFYNGTATVNENTSSHYQNVTQISLSACTGSSRPFINFTAYNETDSGRINPFDFEASFSYYWLGDGSQFKSVSFDDDAVAEKSLCLTPADKTMKVSGVVEYDANGTYVSRNYYFDSFSVTNDTTNISLYLLDASDSTTFIQHVKSRETNVEDAYVYMYRYYPDSDSWKVVQISKTDSDGKTVGFYEAELTTYRHEIYLDTTLKLNETEGRKIYPESAPYTITFQIGDTLQDPTDIFDDEEGITKTLSFDDDTKIVTFEYTDTSGSLSQARLSVYEERANQNDILRCNVTSTEASASLTCDMNNYNGTFIARGYIQRSPEDIIDTIRFIINTVRDTFGTLGLFLGFFIILTVAMIFIWSPIVAIIALVASTVLLNLIGIFTFSGVWIWSLIAIGIILIWLFKD